MFTKITETDMKNKGVVGLPDTPNLSTTEMQAKLDELSTDVIVPKFNNLVDELSDPSAAESIGIEAPDKFTGITIKDLIYQIVDIVLSNQEKAHEHPNKDTIDGITDQNLSDLGSLVNLFSGIASVASAVTDSLTEIPNNHAIVEYVKALGSGDMLKAIYDSNNSGVVDNAEKLGGFEPEWYQKVMDNNLDTDSKTIPGAINELLYELALLNGNVGTIVDLQTVVKSSIVDAINEVIGKIPNMLSTLEEVDANTESGKVADALTLKQVNRKLPQYDESTDTVYLLINGEKIILKEYATSDIKYETFNNIVGGSAGNSVTFTNSLSFKPNEVLKVLIANATWTGNSGNVQLNSWSYNPSTNAIAVSVSKDVDTNTATITYQIVYK